MSIAPAPPHAALAGTPAHEPPAALAARIAAAGCVLHFDVSPLLEESWTGIPMVAAGLARELLAAMPAPARRFFLDGRLLHEAAVRDALERNTGLFLSRDHAMGRAVAGPLHLPPGLPSIGLYPSVKRLHGVFRTECSLVHDLTTLVTPHFHVADNIAHHTETLLHDLASNDVTFCVSEAVRADLLAYLGLKPQAVVVAHNGVHWPDAYARRYADEVGEEPDAVEPFLLVLGTREPRKNIARVLACLAEHPSLLDSHRVVFAGKAGWMEAPPGLDEARSSGRILFTGYVSEAEKYRLLRAAALTLYPSLNEGFGLPVLESLSVGTPCITSFSSSLPEVGGALCRYVDPFSTAELHDAIREELALPAAEAPARRERLRARARRFTWAAMLSTMLRTLEPLVLMGR